MIGGIIEAPAAVKEHSWVPISPVHLNIVKIVFENKIVKFYDTFHETHVSVRSKDPDTKSSPYRLSKRVGLIINLPSLITRFSESSMYTTNGKS